MNQFLEWGIYIQHHEIDPNEINFIMPRPHHSLEALYHVIVPIDISFESRYLISSSRTCVLNKFISLGKSLQEYSHRNPICNPREAYPDKYIVVITREKEEQRVLIGYDSLVDMMVHAFGIPSLIVSMKRHMNCPLGDNLRLFRDAVGFIAPHGMDFVHAGFMARKSNRTLLIQFVPPGSNPFSDHINTHMKNAQALGHSIINIALPSTGPPSWNLNFSKETFFRQACKHTYLFSEWLPNSYWNRSCNF